MKKLILLISVLLFCINSFSQEKTILLVNFEELKQENVIYDIYVVVDLFNESCVYRYLINNETINDIVYLSSNLWIEIPIEKEFASDTIEIWWVEKSENHYVEGEFKEIINLCYKTKFEFKKSKVGIYVIKSQDFHKF